MMLKYVRSSEIHVWSAIPDRINWILLSQNKTCIAKSSCIQEKKQSMTWHFKFWSWVLKLIFSSLKITGYVEKRSTSVTCILSRNGQSYEHNLKRRSTVLRKQIIVLLQESSTLWKEMYDSGGNKRKCVTVEETKGNAWQLRKQKEMCDKGGNKRKCMTVEETKGNVWQWRKQKEMCNSGGNKRKCMTGEETKGNVWQWRKQKEMCDIGRNKRNVWQWRNWAEANKQTSFSWIPFTWETMGTCQVTQHHVA